MIGERLLDYAREVYGPRLEEGLAFQDFILEQLHAHGIVLQAYSSKSGQQKGENMLGLEIKFDRKLAATGSLYVETHERSHPDRPELVPSGIFRADRCWLFGIGNYDRFFVFGKRCLQRLAAAAGRRQVAGVRQVTNDTGTSRGFLLAEALARDMAEKVFEFKEAGR